MKKQIHLDINEEVEIFVGGKKVLTIDQVSDNETIDCYLYSDCFSPMEHKELIADGCFGELIVDIS